MAENIQKETVAEKLEKAVSKSLKAIVAVTLILVVAMVAVVIASVVNSKNTEAGIEKVDSISYALTKDASNLSDDDVAKRQATALEQLSSLTAKSGIVGVRANMLVADIKFAQKNYAEAKDAYVKAAEGKKEAYTAPLSYFNAGVCAEELDDADSAVKFYKAASEAEEFVLGDHVLFSLGRVYETKASYADAKAAYEKLNDLHPTSSWAQLAKARLIALKAAGNIQ